MSTPIEIVEQGVNQFAQGLHAQVEQEHPYVQAAVDGYLDILQCGGKRTRGVLALCAYDIFGGEDTQVISEAAGAIEAMHAYLLVVDDVADRALTRRGKPAAHIALQQFLEKEGADGDTQQTAEDLAISAALTAQHHAQGVFAGLNVPAERRLASIMNINGHLVRTGMGQLLDMASTTGVDMTEDDILTVAERKTAYYSFQLPLETGALLAGASHDAIGPLAQYAVHAGVAFQLRDDVLGMFGDATKMGKSVMSDLTEGKQTLLINHALQNGDAAQQSTLRRALGNTELTNETFADCQQILIETGALQAIEDRAAREAAQAHDALDTCPAEWPCSQIDFLRAVVSHSITRNI